LRCGQLLLESGDLGILGGSLGGGGCKASMKRGNLGGLVGVLLVVLERAKRAFPVRVGVPNTGKDMTRISTPALGKESVPNLT